MDKKDPGLVGRNSDTGKFVEAPVPDDGKRGGNSGG